jgi:hypothetical protein
LTFRDKLDTWMFVFFFIGGFACLISAMVNIEIESKNEKRIKHDEQQIEKDKFVTLIRMLDDILKELININKK